MNLVSLLAIVVFISWVYWLLALWATRSFFSGKQKASSEFTPPVSILKPLRGLDHQIYYNLRSFCTQDYPRFEILFGVQSLEEPSVPIVQQLSQEFPAIPIKIVVAEPRGANRKVGLLEALASRAQYPILVISDSDIRVPPDYLRRVIAPLADPETGLVTCLYRGQELDSLAAKVEALYISANFLPSAIIGFHWLRMSYAFGSTIVIGKEELEEIGGFGAIANHLADDYEIGARVKAIGRKVLFSDCIVETVLGPVRWGELWHRQLRWMRCSWVSRPREYPGIVLTLSIPLSLVVALLTGFSFLGKLLLLTSIAVRFITGWIILGYMGHRQLRRSLPLLPIADLFHGILWAVAPLGKRIVWRDEEYILQRDGRLIPVKNPGFRTLIPFFRSHKGK
ncbi:MAG: hypothetical protein DRI61_01830 [Chloroflexi bacterium]|nr:MAG: hypothetical protein DRI61_01830 [Chloroflexota bacterium]